jgi:hypothetical protein
MASLYVLKKLYKGLAPNTFVPAIVNTDIIISCISKLFIEHTLLKIEMSVYNTLLAIPIFAIPIFTPISKAYPEIVIPFFFCSVLTFFFCSVLTLPIIYGVPIYRTYKSIVNKKIEIINFKK